MSSPLLRDVQKRHPRFFRAVAADARVTLAYRAEKFEIRRSSLLLQIFRLSWVSDAFLAQVFYRAKARLQYFRIPLIPTILHRLAMMHSQVVIDGFTKISSGVVIFPWVTIGLKAGNFQGPMIENDVHIGTGSKIIGPVTLGQGAMVGANSVVIKNVESHQTVGGIPAEVLK